MKFLDLVALEAEAASEAIDVKDAGAADVEVLALLLAQHYQGRVLRALCWIWWYCFEDSFLYRLEEVNQRTSLGDKAAIATCDVQRVLSVQDGSLGSGQTPSEHKAVCEMSQESPQ